MDTEHQDEVTVTQVFGDQVNVEEGEQVISVDIDACSERALGESGRAGTGSESSASKPGDDSQLNHTKDTTKRKKANKIAAKLKQTKLDARREQFLAQVIGAKAGNLQQAASICKGGETGQEAGQGDGKSHASTSASKVASAVKVVQIGLINGNVVSTGPASDGKGTGKQVAGTTKDDRKDRNDTRQTRLESNDCAIGENFARGQNGSGQANGLGNHPRSEGCGPLSLSSKMLDGTEFASAAKNECAEGAGAKEAASRKAVGKLGKKEKKVGGLKEGVKRTPSLVREGKVTSGAQESAVGGDGSSCSGPVHDLRPGVHSSVCLEGGKENRQVKNGPACSNGRESTADKASSGSSLQETAGCGEGTEEGSRKVQKDLEICRASFGKKKGSGKHAKKGASDGTEKGGSGCRDRAGASNGNCKEAGTSQSNSHTQNGCTLANGHAETRGKHAATNGHVAGEERVGESRESSSRTSSSWGGSVSEDERNGRESDTEDDWEAAADALWQEAEKSTRAAHAQGRQGNGLASADAEGRAVSGNPGPTNRREGQPATAGDSSIGGVVLGFPASAIPGFRKKGLHHQTSFPAGGFRQEYQCEAGTLRPEYTYTTSGLGMRSRSVNGVNGRAWRPDDAARPHTLPPPAANQHDGSSLEFPSLGSSAEGWQLGMTARPAWTIPPAAPSFCPICTEELDTTDSSFVPCSCGFRLCLFCHHRIASDDGRCPGCRKEYSTEVASKLSRTPSVWLRIS